MSDQRSRLWPHPSVEARTIDEWDDLWRPSTWTLHPSQPQASTLATVALIALLVYANVVVNEVIAPPWYVPFNVIVLVIAVFIARRSGATWAALGLARDRMGRGLRFGIIGGVVVIVAVVAASQLPATADAFDDARVTDGTLILTAYHAFFRIPIGTALYEEVIFRGVLFGLLARRLSFMGAALWSSVLFGLWHVLPTLDTIRTNAASDIIGNDLIAVVLGVLATTVAGLGFVWLRGIGHSVLTPIIVHMAANSTAVLVAAMLADVT